MFDGVQHATIHGGIFTNIVPPQANTRGLRHLSHHVAGGAFHNSAERYDAPRCYPTTREAVVKKIINWVESSYLNKLYFMWLYGPAGAGKSAIAQTLAELCHEQHLLAACFFFSRIAPGRNDTSCFIPTLAYQLAIAIPEMIKHINEALTRDPMLISKSLEDQMKELILTPLEKAIEGPKTKSNLKGSDATHNPPRPKPPRPMPPRIIIIDGLDECKESHMQRAVLNVLLFAVRQKINHWHQLVFLIASRPEQEIRNTFNKNPITLLTTRLVLDDAYEPDVDIRKFLSSQFQELRETHPLKSQLPSPWPTEQDFDLLIEKSSGQFIYAATVAKVIRTTTHLRPTHVLEVVLKLADPGDLTPFVALDALYSHILDSSHETGKVTTILGLLILSKLQERNPNVIEDFFLYERGDLQLILADLHSIIYVPPLEEPGELCFFHASLVDFLLDRSRAHRFYIDTGKVSMTLTRQCIQHCLPLMQLARSGSEYQLLEIEPYQDFSRKSLMELWVQSLPTKDWAIELCNFDILAYLNMFGHGSRQCLSSVDWLFDALPNLFDWMNAEINTFDEFKRLYHQYLIYFDTYLRALFDRYPKGEKTMLYLALATFPEEDINIADIIPFINALVVRDINKGSLRNADFGGLKFFFAPSNRSLRHFKMISEFLTDKNRAGEYHVDKKVYIRLARSILIYLYDPSYHISTKSPIRRLLSATLVKCSITPSTFIELLRRHHASDTSQVIEAYMRDQPKEPPNPGNDSNEKQPVRQRIQTWFKRKKDG